MKPDIDAIRARADAVSEHCGKLIVTEQAKTKSCDHSNKSYGETQYRKRPWICRDCGQQGHVEDKLYDADYYPTLVQHMQKGTLKGEEEAK